jgi:GT2 family glycosyltransferase
MSDVLVAVVSYNNLDLTVRAVQALQAQTVPTRFVVWDNASTDGTQEWLKRCNIEHVNSRENVYWTPAINQVIQDHWAGETYIGWMNNDAAPMPHTVERMLRLLSKEDIGLVAPSMERIGGQQDIAFCEGTNLVHQGGDIDSRLQNLEGKRVTFVLGAFALTKKKVWDVVGPLDATMPLGADDHDWCIRLKQARYQIWVAQDAYCRHGGHSSARVAGASEIWDQKGGESWEAFNNKWCEYYKTEDEAIKCHWGGIYTPGYDR